MKNGLIRLSDAPGKYEKLRRQYPPLPRGTAWPQEIPKWRRSALPWTLDDLLKMGKERLPR